MKRLALLNNNQSNTLMDGGGATIQTFEVSSTSTRMNDTGITSSVSVVTKMENTR